MEILGYAALALGALLAAILLFMIIVILFGWVKIYFSYSEKDGVKLAASVFGVKITLYPRKKKAKKEKTPKEKKEEPSEKTAEKENKKKPSLIPGTTGGKIRLFFEILEVVKFRIKLFRFRLRLLYGAGDAAKTAVDIGRMHAALAAFLALSSNAVEINPVDVVITPNYLDSAKKAETDIIIGLKILSAAVTAVRVYRAAVKFRKKESEEK